MLTKDQNLREIKRTFAFYKQLDVFNQKRTELAQTHRVCNGSCDINNSIASMNEKINEEKEKREQLDQELELVNSSTLSKPSIDTKPKWNSQYIKDHPVKELKDYPKKKYLLVSILGTFLVFWLVVEELILPRATYWTMTILDSDPVNILAIILYIAICILVYEGLKRHFYYKLYLKDYEAYQVKYKKYQELYENYKAQEESAVQEKDEINCQINDINENIKKYQQEIQTLEGYLSHVQQIETQVNDKIADKQKLLLNNFDEVKENFVKNTDHFIVPRKHQYNWGYYGALYEIIETGQEKEIPDAIRLLEDRYQRAELTEILRKQIADSEKHLSDTMIEVAKQICEAMHKCFDEQAVRIEAQSKQLNKSLNAINASINNSNQNIVSSLTAVNSSINDLNFSVTDSADRFDNGINELQDNIRDGASQINKTVDTNMAMLDKDYMNANY